MVIPPFQCHSLKGTRPNFVPPAVYHLFPANSLQVYLQYIFSQRDYSFCKEFGHSLVCFWQVLFVLVWFRLVWYGFLRNKIGWSLGGFKVLFSLEWYFIVMESLVWSFMVCMILCGLVWSAFSFFVKKSTASVLLEGM